jgi:hypothetical protein
MPVEDVQGYLVLTAVESTLQEPALFQDPSPLDFDALLTLQEALERGQPEVLEDPRLASQALAALITKRDSYRGPAVAATLDALRTIVEGAACTVSIEDLGIDFDLLREAVRVARKNPTILDEHNLSLRDADAVAWFLGKAQRRPGDWARLLQRQPDAAAQAYLLLDVSGLANRPTASRTLESLLPIALTSPWGRQRTSPFIRGFDSSLPPPLAKREPARDGLEIYEGMLAAISNGSPSSADGAMMRQNGPAFRTLLSYSFPQHLRQGRPGASFDSLLGLRQSFEQLRRSGGQEWDGFLTSAQIYLSERQRRHVEVDEIWDALTEGNRSDPLLQSLRETMGVSRGELARVLDLSRSESFLQGAGAVVRVRETVRPGK